MKTSSFIAGLLLVTVVAGLLIAGLYLFIPQVQQYALFGLSSVILFVVVCVSLFLAGLRAQKSVNKNAFTELISLSVFGKMGLVVVYLFVFQQMAKPQNDWYVVVFLLCYSLYTAFEVWFMTRLARH
jgi:predicted permease